MLHPNPPPASSREVQSKVRARSPPREGTPVEDWCLGGAITLMAFGDGIDILCALRNKINF